MSMSGWDMPNVSNGDNGAFDPSMAFGGNAQSIEFDPSRMQAPQAQGGQFPQQMQNGNFRHASPGSQNPMFQTSSVVPSKRPHSDYSASPSQMSRSQTPQQQQAQAQGPQNTSYSNFGPNMNGQPGPTPYQHLQQPPSGNASPSPVIQSQAFPQNNMAQRMGTSSPSPFTPAAQGFGTQRSPANVDQAGHFEPHANGGPPQMPNSQFHGGQNPQGQGFSPSAGNVGLPFQGTPQQMNQRQMAMEQQQRMMFEAKMRQMGSNGAMTPQQMQQMQQMQAMNAANSSGQMGQMQQMQGAQGAQGMQGPNSAIAHQQQQIARAQQMQRLMLPSSPDQFLRAVASYMQQRGTTFNYNPNICGRAVHPVNIYTHVIRAGGSRRVTAGHLWPRVAMALGFQPQQVNQAGAELSNYWQSNILPYEMGLLQNVQHQQQQRQQHPGQAPPNQRPGSENGMPQPAQQPNQHSMGHLQGSPPPQQVRRPSIVESTTPVRPPTAPQDQPQFQPNGLQPRDGPPQLGMAAPSVAQELALSRPQQDFLPKAVSSIGAPKQQPQPEMTEIDEEFKPVLYTWPGGKSREVFFEPDGATSSAADVLEKFVGGLRPSEMLEPVDVRALAMCLKSGIHSQIRLALDFLSVTAIRTENPLPLKDCEDLLDALVDCADLSVELLTDNATDESDTFSMPSYADVVRACERETTALQDVPEFGSLEHDLERAADVAVCITTLLRNFALQRNENYRTLADPTVVKLVTTSIRSLGTCATLLRTNRRTLDFMKDLLVILSSTALELDFASKEQASCVLHFLLAFSPNRASAGIKGDDTAFPRYQPESDRYLPLAVDALAKLFARGDPNRSFLKTVLLGNSATESSRELLSQCFAMGIAPVPNSAADSTLTPQHPLAGPIQISLLRLPFLAQGLLVAETILLMVPSNEQDLVKSWVDSSEGIIAMLSSLILLMHTKLRSFNPMQQPDSNMRLEIDLLCIVRDRSTTLIHKLRERSSKTETTNGTATHASASETGEEETKEKAE